MQHAQSFFILFQSFIFDNSCYSTKMFGVMTLVMLIAISSLRAQSNDNELKEVSRRFDELEKLICSNKDKFTDEVVADIDTKCKCKDANKIKV